MKKIWTSIGLLSLIALLGFNIDNRPIKANGPQSITAADIQGTWLLMMEKHGENAQMHPPQRGHVKKKLITGNHFSWVEYTEDGQLLAMAGGTYKLNGGVYTEDIEYCFPKGSNLLGVSIPFSYKFDDGLWLHSGFLQERQIDGETGEYVVRETYKISEVWKKVKE